MSTIENYYNNLYHVNEVSFINLIK